MRTSSLRNDAAVGTAFSVSQSIDDRSSIARESATKYNEVALGSTFAGWQGDFRAKAAMSRAAGRMNALYASTEEYERLVTERAELLEKEFSSTITKREGHRLTLVLWHLDRIDDARHGDELDALEDSIETYERFSRRLDAFQNEISAAVAAERRHA